MGGILNPARGVGQSGRLSTAIFAPRRRGDDDTRGGIRFGYWQKTPGREGQESASETRICNDE